MPGDLALSTAAQSAADLNRYGFGRAHSFATQKQIPFRDPKPIRHSCRDRIDTASCIHITVHLAAQTNRIIIKGRVTVITYQDIVTQVTIDVVRAMSAEDHIVTGIAFYIIVAADGQIRRCDVGQDTVGIKVRCSVITDDYIVSSVAGIIDIVTSFTTKDHIVTVTRFDMVYAT